MKYTGKKENIKYISDREDSGSRSDRYAAASGRQTKGGYEKRSDLHTNSGFVNDRTSNRFNNEKPDYRFLQEKDLLIEDENDMEEPPVRRTIKEWIVEEILRKPLVLAGSVLLAVEFVLSIIFVILLIDFGIFASYMLVAAIAVVVIFFAAALLLQLGKKRSMKIASMIISGLMCIVLIIGDFYILRANDVISSITGSAYNVNTYMVAVLADDSAENLKDAADYTFGTMSNINSDNFKKAMEEVNKEAGKTVKTSDFSTVSKLHDALFNEDVGAVIYESSFETIMVDMDEDFLSKIKVIAQIKIKEDAEAPTASDADVLNNPYAIFISGNDQWDEISLTGRSDVNIICVVNPKNHQVLLVTIPRDYYVEFPGVSDGSRDKLTHAGIYGTDVQLDTIENIFGMEDIDYYVKVNFSSLVEIIDAIGGLDIYNPYSFSTTSAEGYYFEEGDLHLSGEEALWYVRERYSIADGDFARGVHQMLVIEALIDQLCSASSVTHFNALMEALEDCAVTNMPDSNIKAIIQDQLKNGYSWDIQKLQAKGTSAYQPSYAAGGQFLSMVIPYQESIDYISSVISKIMSGELLENVEDNMPEGKTLAVSLVDYVDDGGDDYYYEETEITIPDEATTEYIPDDISQETNESVTWEETTTAEIVTEPETVSAETAENVPTDEPVN